MVDADVVRVAIDAGVCVLTIENPPVNALSGAVMRGLDDGLRAARDDQRVRAVGVTGRGKSFVAGADISRLERIAEGEAPAGPALGALLDLLEHEGKPSVAAIDGFALGGGLELAMACNARIGTPRARIGLPELALGLIPGAGGTQRLPRLIGLERAVDLMLDSSQLSADEALALGALDEVVDSDALLERAKALALELADEKRPRRESLKLTDKLPAFEQAEEIVARARARALRRARGVKHPEACLDAVLTGVEHGAAAGLVRERERFEELLKSDSARALIHLFFAERAAAKVPGITSAARPIERVAVLGGGTMGSGIATALLVAGVDVVLAEVAEEPALQARKRIANNVEHGVRRGKLTADAARSALARLAVRTDWSGFDDVGLVIEAATEDLGLKQKLFADLATKTPSSTWLASNTSTIGIEILASAAGAPERVLGAHFFSPAHVMKLVEVVRTDATSPQALADVLAICKRMKKTAVTVRSCTGFLVNRIFMPYGQTAGFLVDRGIDPYRIDRALFEFGMPMGPFRMSDLAGIDVGVAAGAILDAAYADRTYRSKLRQLLVAAGRLGEKAGKGHYAYREGNAIEDPELGHFVLEARTLAGDPEPIELDDEEIVFMTLFGVVNEACRALEEGVALRASDVDVASVLGMGFPAHRGGILWWADTIGARRLHAALSGWHDRFGLGSFRPSDLLAEKARAGGRLSPA